MRPRAVVAFAGVLAVVPSTALADHTREERIVDQTAYTLPAGRFQIGLLRQLWGPLDWLMVGTYAVPWFFRIVNAHAKLRILGEDPLALAVQVGFVRAEPRFLEEKSGNAIVTAVPIEVFLSWRIDDRFTFSPGAAYAAIDVDGRYDPAELEGVLAVSNGQLTGAFEVRLTTTTAFVLHGRYLVFQDLSGRASSTFEPDRFTTVQVDAVGSSDALDFTFAGSVFASVVFSWEVVNLRLGLGYGNFNVPGINLVVPDARPLPDLDLYVRF